MHAPRARSPEDRADEAAGCIGCAIVLLLLVILPLIGLLEPWLLPDREQVELGVQASQVERVGPVRARR